MEKLAQDNYQEIQTESHFPSRIPNNELSSIGKQLPLIKTIQGNEDIMAISQEKQIHSELARKISSHYTLNGQRPAELNALINELEFKNLQKNPWDINVSQTIEDFQKRVYDNAEIKFRIGGRVIYSTSRLINAKSNLILQKSVETQQEMEENPEEELNESDVQDWDSMEDILGDYDDELFSQDIPSDIKNQEEMKAYLEERNQMLEKHIDTTPFFKEDRMGQRFLSGPIRKVYRKIDFSDLGHALGKTLNYQLRRNVRDLSQKRSQDIKASDILPEQVLKKTANDKAQVELQIQRLLEKITSNYLQRQEPVPFLSLIITPNPDGIVRTLLYLLQLVNRKKIELWQQFEENEETLSHDLEENTGSGLDIFISPWNKH